VKVQNGAITQDLAFDSKHSMPRYAMHTVREAVEVAALRRGFATEWRCCSGRLREWSSGMHCIPLGSEQLTIQNHLKCSTRTVVKITKILVIDWQKIFLLKLQSII
jgi:hypothetical protein